jgi:hypothetical protein
MLHLPVRSKKRLPWRETCALAQFDAETRFRARAACGSAEAGLRLLDTLDKATHG